MNSFLSGGTEYLSSIKNRYIHKRISLAPVAVPAVGSAAAGLLNSPASSFGTVSYAVSLLASEKVSDPYERRIYDTAVTKVYAERHSYAGLDTKQMLAGMSSQERTKVLSLIVKELGSKASVPVNVSLPAGKAAEADIPAAHTAAPSETERRTIRTVVKKIVDSIIKPSGMDKTAPVKSAESDERVRVLTAPAAEKFTVTEREMTLLKLLSEDKSGNIAKAVKASGNGGDTVSERLNILYHGIAGGSTEKIVAENVENALYMPTVLNFYDTARLIPAEPADNTPAAQIIAADSGDVRITNNRAADNREFPVYRKDIRNINNIQTHTGLTQNTQDTVIQQDIYAPSEMRGIQGTNVTGVRTVADAAGSYGALRVHNASRGVPANAYPSAAILRSGIYSGEIVRTALEKIAGYERAHNAPGTRTGKRGTASEIADGRGYADTARNFVFSTAVNEYSLPVTLLPENKVSESVRLLPVYTLDRVILPGKLPEIKTNGKKALNRLSAPKERSFAVLKHRMAIINDRKMSAKKSADSAQESTGFPVSAETYTVPMDRMMPDETVLSYREPIPASAPAPATPAAVSQPSTSDLVKQFGNLIEGGDAGLVPSFDVGTRGIGEAMAAIEETAEKVAVNSKLIEEIREKQRTIETVTLKSSDMDAISEEMIRRLRSRMRLDRSRFAGQ